VTPAKTLPIALGTFGGLFALWLGLHLGIDDTESWRLAARWTARVGFPIFLMTYSASSLYKIAPSALTRGLLRTRRQWGLGFAIAHSIHLFALVTFLRISGEVPPALTLYGGGFGYIMLYTMALTSNDRAMEMLDRNWKYLHSFGIHTLWVIYTFSYAKRLIVPDPQLIPRLFTALALGALMLRFMRRSTVKPPRIQRG
jgi:methionine sulfoxide reductase heme-binding subunit